MKIINLLLVVLGISTAALADDKYSDMVYTATAFMYWCTYSEVPRSVEDFAKVTDVNDPNAEITLSPEDWFQTVRFEVIGDKLQVVREGGATQHAFKSTSNCESFRILRPQSNQAPKLTH